MCYTAEADAKFTPSRFISFCTEQTDHTLAWPLVICLETKTIPMHRDTIHPQLNLSSVGLLHWRILTISSQEDALWLPFELYRKAVKYVPQRSYSAVLKF